MRSLGVMGGFTDRMQGPAGLPVLRERQASGCSPDPRVIPALRVRRATGRRETATRPSWAPERRGPRGPGPMGLPTGTIAMWMGSSRPLDFFCVVATPTTPVPQLHSFLSANLPVYSAGTLPDYRGYFPGGMAGRHELVWVGNRMANGDPSLTVNSNGSHSHTNFMYRNKDNARIR